MSYIRSFSSHLRCGCARISAHLRNAYAYIRSAWLALRPAQKLTIGLASYVAAGVLLLSIPLSQKQHISPIDNLFIVTSAMSTTGLATVSITDSYSILGQLIVLILIQLGGIGYMTVSSFLILARGNHLSQSRLDIHRAGFTLPQGFEMHVFLRHVVIFTFIIEALGAALLYGEFRMAGTPYPLWSAIFHSISAFATAGFGLHNNSLVDYVANPIVTATISIICYLGAIGFIVIQDAWYALTRPGYRITFTSKTILFITATIFVVGTPILAVTDPSLHALPNDVRWQAAAFQIMTASTTAGFNTVAIESLAPASLSVLIIVMIIGASPSGTGGGIKTTSFSALMAVLLSVVRGRDRITFLGHQIPLPRILSAVASITLYLSCFTLGLIALALVESKPFLDLAFEAASAIGTVGLSMGITSSLSILGKLIVIVLMFIGRAGPLTIGLALLERKTQAPPTDPADLAV